MGDNLRDYLAFRDETLRAQGNRKLRSRLNATEAKLRKLRGEFDRARSAEARKAILERMRAARAQFARWYRG